MKSTIQILIFIGAIVGVVGGLWFLSDRHLFSDGAVLAISLLLVVVVPLMVAFSMAGRGRRMDD